MLSADPTKVSQRAKKRGLPQVAFPLTHFHKASMRSTVCNQGTLSSARLAVLSSTCSSTESTGIMQLSRGSLCRWELLALATTTQRYRS